MTIEPLESRIHPAIIGVYAMLPSNLVHRGHPLAITPEILASAPATVKERLTVDGKPLAWSTVKLTAGWDSLPAVKLPTSAIGRHTVMVEVLVGKVDYRSWTIGYSVEK